MALEATLPGQSQVQELDSPGFLWGNPTGRFNEEQSRQNRPCCGIQLLISGELLDNGASDVSQGNAPQSQKGGKGTHLSRHHQAVASDASGHRLTPGYRYVPKTAQHTLPWAIWPSSDAWIPICRCSVAKATVRPTAAGLGKWLLGIRRGRRLGHGSLCGSTACCWLLGPCSNCYV